MSRKGKGAALFELLYRDKGKTTNEQGALKLPSWFRTKPQGTLPGVMPQAPSSPTVPAAPATPGAPAPSPAPATAAAPTPAPAPAQKPATPSPAPAPSAGPTFPTQPAAPASARPAPPTTAAAPMPVKAPTISSPRMAPPWATGPWIQVGSGRLRLSVTTFAAGVVGIAMLGLLIASFALGRWSAPARTANPAASPTPAGTSLADARKQSPDPAIVGRSSPAPSASPSPSPSPTASPTPTASPVADGRPIAGRSYVVVQTFGTTEDQLKAAQKLVAALQARQVNALVAQQADKKYLVRVNEPLDRDVAASRALEIDALLATMATELRGIVRPGAKTFVKTY